MRKLGIALILMILCVPFSYGKDPQISIVSPGPNQIVGDTATVRGQVDDPNAEIWVLVHPLTGPNFWVQPKAKTSKSGQWAGLAHFGNPGVHSGVQFEITAVKNPAGALKVGQVLQGLPDADAWSNSVVVTKQ